MSEIFMSREETAKALNLSVRTVDSLILRREIAVRRVGRRVLIPTDEIKRFAGGAGNAATVAPVRAPLTPAMA